ncbi:MAG: S24/S26 family peptidase [Methanobrevibacter sp.]|nr:S24/S26 family peptidase [Methanobrevibacter sp.]
MKKLSKAFILIIIIIFLLAIASVVLFDGLEPTSDIYIENNTVTCSIFPFCENQGEIENKICDYVLSELNNPNSNISTIKLGVEKIASEYGVNNLKVNINSEIGKNKIPITYTVDGESMVPTLQNGQTVLVEKTKNISVNDIVVAKSPKYGVIIKRVDQINGNQVHLISDNKNINYEEVNGTIYETKGITTWVDVSNIYGVAISY